MQLAITVSVVAGYGNPVAQSVVGIVIIFGWGLLAFLTAPFLSSLADISETTSRASSLLTLIFTLIAHSSGGSSALGALINIVQAVGLTVMVLCILSDLPPVRRVLRNLAPVLIFEDSVGNVVRPPHLSPQLGVPSPLCLILTGTRCLPRSE